MHSDRFKFLLEYFSVFCKCIACNFLSSSGLNVTNIPSIYVTLFYPVVYFEFLLRCYYIGIISSVLSFFFLSFLFLSSFINLVFRFYTFFEVQRHYQSIQDSLYFGDLTLANLPPLFLFLVLETFHMLWNMVSEYELNKNWDETHPCRTHLLISMSSEVMFWVLMCSVLCG